MNLFNINTAVLGVIAGAGQDATSTTTTRSDYIPVTPALSYMIYDSDKVVNLDYQSNVYWYTSAKVWISTSTTGGSTTVGVAVTAPSNAAYATFTITRLPALNTKVMFTKSDAVVDVFVPFGYSFDPTNLTTPFYINRVALSPALRNLGADTAYSLNQQSGLLLPKAMSFMTASVNLYNPSSPQIVQQAYLNAAGNYNPSGSPTQQVASIPVTAGLTYSFYQGISMTKVTPSLNILNYTGTSTSIASTTYSSDGFYTVPVGAQYIRITTAINEQYFTVVVGNTPPSSYTSYGYSFTSDVVGVSAADKYPWLAKNAGFLGDSITLQALWVPAFLQNTRMSQGYIEGINGGALSYMGKNLTAAILAPLDYIHILGGTNNYGVSPSPIGDVNSPIDDSTVHGQVKNLVSRILTLKPNIRIVFFTPFNRTFYAGSPSAGNGYTPNSAGVTIKMIAEAMIDECRYLGIPCFDMLSNSGITSYNIGTSTVDGLHPNSYMAAILGKRMAAFANSVVPFS